MKEIAVILSCTWKFALTFPVAIFGLKYSFWKTLLLTNTGGLIGLLVSMYLSRFILFIWYHYLFPRKKNSHNKKHVFSRKSRRFVRIKNRYGLTGIAIFTHSVLSIPIGAFLVTRYYGSKLHHFLLLMTAQITWSLIYTVFYMYVQERITAIF